jgi:predicted nucleotide-binding protein
LRLAERLAELNGADSQSFFDAYGLGDAYRSPGRGSSRKAMVTAAIYAAEQRGDVDDVLDAARAYLDGQSLPEEVSTGSPAVVSHLPTPTTMGQQLLLQMMWGLFSLKAKWPTFQEIDRKFDRAYEQDIVDVTRKMPNGLIVPQNLQYLNPDQEIKLTIAGVAACDGSAELLGLFLGAVRLAAALEAELLESDDEPTLTSDSLRALGSGVMLPVAGREQVLIQLGLLLGAESWGWSTYSAGSSGKPTWQFHIGREVRRLRRVRSIDDYWRATRPLVVTQPIAPVVIDESEDIVTEAKPDTIFLVHGHDESRHEVARFLDRSTPEDVRVIVLNEQANRGLTIIEKFEQFGNDAAYAVVLMTPDDVGRSVKAKDLDPRARQNVVFELGYFIGRLGRGHVAVLNKGVEEPSDFKGIVYIPFPGGSWKLDLARELRAAGFDTDPTRI